MNYIQCVFCVFFLWPSFIKSISSYNIYADFQEIGNSYVDSSQTSLKTYFQKISGIYRFHDANTLCRNYGMNLVSFDDDREQKALFRLMSMLPQEIHWTGYNDFRFSRNWESDQGISPSMPLGFRAGEPNNAGGNERCIHMYKYDDGVVNLNDHECEQRFRVMCQKATTITTTTTTTSTTTTSTTTPSTTTAAFEY